MYTYEIDAGYSTMDASLCMTVPAILDHFQDAAIFEAENGTITMDYLDSHHLAWILSSWQIVIGRRPRLNERIKIATLPYAFKGFLGYRNFTLSDREGGILVRGASIWTLIDTGTLHPVRPSQELLDGYVLGEKIDMPYAPRKIALLGGEVATDRFRVRKSQIDSNRHMNNVEYVRLAMETLPDDAPIRELRAEYKKAAHFGDGLTASVMSGGDVHQVVLRDDAGETYAVVEFTCGQGGAR